MRLRSEKVDDVVEVDRRLAFLMSRQGQRVRVRFAHGARETRTVTTRQITRHWRQAPKNGD